MLDILLSDMSQSIRRNGNSSKHFEWTKRKFCLRHDAFIQFKTNGR